MWLNIIFSQFKDTSRLIALLTWGRTSIECFSWIIRSILVIVRVKSFRNRYVCFRNLRQVRRSSGLLNDIIPNTIVMTIIVVVIIEMISTHRRTSCQALRSHRRVWWAFSSLKLTIFNRLIHLAIWLLNVLILPLFTISLYPRELIRHTIKIISLLSLYCRFIDSFFMLGHSLVYLMLIFFLRYLCI